ncbi:phospholipase C, phosphocholine-specific [Gluconobacter cerinus]|uniref:phosphocholine-specific phospholipase C n=1 Tax=Gluconobacter cerinus TaxID=38307 RepID=UPI001B8CE537|nr:phospholipase C, phosphocholine-specific [Gluconobacter cerinus]MBS1072916.1 phospholipase C, phosphocholine-specific [Gluconobacter cerinus]
MSQDRRAFLKLLGTGFAATALQSSIRNAMALPANNRTGSIKDVDHIVILMQENRSFDHYYGTLSGVRGFGDPRTARLPNGKPVWRQPHGDGELLPFRPKQENLGLSFIGDTPHDWNTTHRAWNEGRWDDWIAHKTTTTMIHFNRTDIPFHYALADAFTICDAYYCSVMGPTYPNRNYMFTGWTGNDGKGHGPQLETDALVCDWPTYPERLEAAGLSWKIYQDTGLGLTAENGWGDDPDHYIGNSANNTLLRFVKYQTALPQEALALKARTGTNIAVSGTLFDDLQKDVTAGTLPQVSWLMCPNAYDEHPNWPANYGAWFISRVIDTLTSNPEVWSRTALFLTYDENDGFFDHIVPPAPPVSPAHGQSTISVDHEIFAGSATHDAGPYGLGPRVPMLVISPWSKGGWVNSEVFDHTSLIRFIERRFGDEHPELIETQITPWRRAVCGDLTSAFDFSNPNSSLSSLPLTASYEPPDRVAHTNSVVKLPLEQIMPRQEAGTRRARALPYDLHVTTWLLPSEHQLKLKFQNSGSATAVFHVRDQSGVTHPRFYTVEPGKSLEDHWPISKSGHYNIDIHGPNGFFRQFSGQVTDQKQAFRLTSVSKPASQRLLLIFDAALADFSVEDGYSQRKTSHTVNATPAQIEIDTTEAHGWYDLTIRSNGMICRLCGHIENGHHSITDPAIGQQTV